MEPLEPPTVHIVDDDPGVSEVLERLLRSNGMQTVTYADVDSFLNGYQEHEVECVLLDYQMPNRTGLDLQRQLAQRERQLPVVMITGHGSTTTAVEAMKLGAVDFIEKPFQSEALMRSVEGALAKGRLAQKERAVASETQRRLSRLTPREREVLDHVVDGHSSKEIATMLGLSKKTVDLHRSHVMSKLEADSIVELMTMVLTGQRKRPERTPSPGQQPQDSQRGARDPRPGLGSAGQGELNAGS